MQIIITLLGPTASVHCTAQICKKKICAIYNLTKIFANSTSGLLISNKN